MHRFHGMAIWIAALVASSALAGPPMGKPVEPTPAESQALMALKGKVHGVIAWSTSREGNHKIWLMNADGTNPHRISSGTKTDWYPKISPDGKHVLFTRSKLDWQSETDANYPERWDTWIVGIDGTGEKMLVPHSTWATWAEGGKSILFARGVDIWKANSDGSQEQKLVDGEKELKGGIAQNPHLSEDGKLLAITLRGKQREVGTFNLQTRKWFASAEGGGCQMAFFPGGHKVYRVNPTGNGGTELYAYDLSAEGTHAPQSGTTIGGKDIRWIDLPGRRSHEYFPQVSPDGKWLVWCATDRGHDHDIVDYEVHLWRIGTPADQATRLTFHSGNDRWPDIHVERP